MGATFRNENGTVLMDHDISIGCRFCMAACPYGARYFNWGEPDNPPGATLAQYSPEYPIPHRHRRGTPDKCMFCAHDAEVGNSRPPPLGRRDGRDVRRRLGSVFSSESAR